MHKKKVDSWTPLHFAAVYGTSDTVKVLLDAGSPTDIQDYTGVSPLHCAIRENKLENMKLILEAEAQVNVETLAGWTPLMYAVRKGTGMMVAEVLKFGAGLDKKLQGYTVYDMAEWNEKHSTDVLTALRSYRDKLSKID